jgi:hypothetical protein
VTARQRRAQAARDHQLDVAALTGALQALRER